METPRIIGFAAFSGTGKTTLVEKLVLKLKLRLAVIKHDAHNFEIDHEGKDSWRFAHAGADMTIISSPKKTAVIEQRPRTLLDNIAMVHDVDLRRLQAGKPAPNRHLPQGHGQRLALSAGALPRGGDG